MEFCGNDSVGDALAMIRAWNQSLVITGKLGVRRCTYNHSAGEMRTGRSLSLAGQTACMVSSRPVTGPTITKITR